eukprot:2836320-Pleurochrysis_carterae.AAC.2
MRAGHWTPHLHRRTALPCPTLLTAMLLKLLLSPPALFAPALEVVGHERITQWEASAVSVPEGTGTADTPSEPSQSVPEACSSRVSETQRSVPEGPDPFAPPPIKTRGFEGGKEREHRPLLHQKVRSISVLSRFC